MHTFDEIKKNFPIFRHRKDLVYLDSTATSLKPQTMIDAVSKYYETLSSNVGRGIYPTAEETTEQVETTRAKTAQFIGAEPEEVIFTRNTTESINLLAFVLSDTLFPVIASEAKQSQNNEIATTFQKNGTSRNDRGNIVVTAMEHHSNYLPWERLARERGAEFRIVPFTTDGTIDTDSLEKYIDKETKIFASVAISNVFGTINPIREFVRKARAINPNILTVIDAAQAAGHRNLDVRAIDCDFLAFSGHKCFGPTGIGVLYGKKSLLEPLPPYQVGGGMVLDACARIPEFRPIPHRFEAGTPDIASIVGFGAALDFINGIGIETIRNHEIKLVTYAVKKLLETFGSDITILGPKDPAARGGLISFTVNGIHPHDLAQMLGESDICVRAGEHCAAPLHHALDLPATTRASFSIYNDTNDIDRLVAAMKEARELMSNP